MKARLFTESAFLVSIVLLALLVPGGALSSATQLRPASLVTPPPAPDRARVAAALQSASVMFIENVGQFDDGARFQVRGGMGTMWLAEDAIWITVVERSPVDVLERLDVQPANAEREDEPLRAVNLKLSFPGANPHPRLEPFDRLDTVVSYFIGNDPDQWHPDVPVWGGVRYVDLYPGMDLVVGASAPGRPQGTLLPWRLEVRDGADLSAVRLHMDGADVLTLDGDCLRLTTAAGDFTLPLLAADWSGSPAAIAGHDVLHPFAPPPDQPTIRPPDRQTTRPQDNPSDLLYSTFLGGNLWEESYAIAVDGAGNAYTTGKTYSSDFPTVAGGFDTSHNGSHDVFVVKMNTTGTGLAYATFLGGSENDSGNAIAVDGAGSAYVTGKTYSPDFPTTAGAFDTGLDGNGDAFVVKLNATGSALVYATFLGGSDVWDVGFAIAVDGSGSAYVTGMTESSDFSTTLGAFDTSYNGSGDAFVVKLNATGSALIYATFLGGGIHERGEGIAVDGSGNAYVTGGTGSSDFPTTPAAFDTSFNGGYGDAFVVKLNATGSALVYATFLGGGDTEWGFPIAVNSAGSTCVTGWTDSSDFPTTPGAFDTSFNGGYSDAFVVKLNATGSALVYATFLGGAQYDEGFGTAIDESGMVYATGRTGSTDFPTTPGAFDTSYSGGELDVFVVKLDATGSTLAYATFLGGSSDDWGEGIAVDGVGNAYATGSTYSSDFPTTAGTFDTSHNGSRDVFVANLAVGGGPGYDRPPIVFVHGWAGWPPWGPCDWPDPDAAFESVDDDLRAAGYYVTYAYLETSPCYTPPLIENVPRLNNAIALAKAATNQPKVILIAHSMGGLVSRAYIEGPDYDEDVAALFTFGSPHRGVPADVFVFLFNGMSLGTICKDYQPAACDMSALGMALFNRDHPTRAAGVTYHVISGDAPFFSRSALGMAIDPFIPGSDDALVPTGSGTGLSGTLDRWETDEVHSRGMGSRTYFIRDGGQSTSYTQCVKPVLVDKTSNICGSVGTLQITAEATPTLAQHTPFECGTLLAGQTVSRTISLEGGPTLFAAQWQTGTLAVTLVDPNGQTIDPAYAASHPDIVTYDADATSATYYFPNAIAGVWQLVLLASSDIPAEGSAYITFAAFDSLLSLTAETDRDWYAPGASATITASLSGSPASAVVTATILRADGVTDTVSLSPLEAGQYQATYTVPDAPGYAEVRLVATGTTAGSVPFERGLSLAFQISSNIVTLSGEYSDTPQPRSPGTSFYEALTVTVGINAIINGTVGLSADLVDADGNFVAHSLTMEDVTTGAGTLALRFDGNDIYASRRNGPYTLTNLLLTDRRGAALVVAEAENVYTTAAYDYLSFASSNIYLPLILRNY